MSNIIIAGGADSQKKLWQMFPQESLVLLAEGIHKAVAESYVKHGMRNPTKEETRRRFNILIENARELRGERKWGVQRICDAMGDILNAELNGGKYVPDDKRTFWLQSDGA